MGISPVPDETERLKELLVRARTGDAQAFCQLVEPLEERLFRQAVALCRNESTAEDLASETLVEAWKSLVRYNESCRLTTWLYSILLHRYQKHIRRARSRPASLAALPAPEASEHEEIHQNLPASDPSPAESLLQSESNQEMRRLIDSLAEKHRDVILLRFFQDASLAEIASVLNCSEGTVKSRMHHALKHLRKMKFSMNPSPATGDT
jgi:RNA polymerase sigma-70 factor, ECF subfamily